MVVKIIVTGKSILTKNIYIYMDTPKSYGANPEELNECILIVIDDEDDDNNNRHEHE